MYINSYFKNCASLCHEYFWMFSVFGDVKIQIRTFILPAYIFLCHKNHAVGSWQITSLLFISMFLVFLMKTMSFQWFGDYFLSETLGVAFRPLEYYWQWLPSSVQFSWKRADQWFTGATPGKALNPKAQDRQLCHLCMAAIKWDWTRVVLGVWNITGQF